ncbi:MAG: pyridoxal-phosphate dependent enzyme [Thermoflexibacter sp.]|jgi:1-aminocyclopropane-1-carboxylate deaminase|nr:pyridoxal-phosphate dependent enzyme [Thermoflexibacter sp.]
MIDFLTYAPIQELKDEMLEKHQVKLLVKREDLIHSHIKGNKWYKLKYNIAQAKIEGLNCLLTFGGAFSNHIYATASAGKLCGLETIGIIRGEPHLPLNPILAHAQACGMTLSYLDRATYRQKSESEVIQQLRAQFGDFYLIPEGGTNTLAIKGTKEIVENIEEKYDYLCCACGTGGTLAGLIVGAPEKVQKIGFSVLKGDFLEKEIEKRLHQAYEQGIITQNSYLNWHINHNYHFGGYAKTHLELNNFIVNFSKKFDIPIEPIYTGKLFYGIFDLIKQGYFHAPSTILVIHSGGVY